MALKTILYFEQKMWPESKLFRRMYAEKDRERGTDSGYMNSKQKKTISITKARLIKTRKYLCKWQKKQKNTKQRQQ